MRDLLTRLDTFAGTFDDQRDNIVSTIVALDRFSGRLAAKDDVITEALRKVSAGPRGARTGAAAHHHRTGKAPSTFSDLATRLVHDAGGDLVKNFQNLDPTIRALADVGPELDAVLAEHPVQAVKPERDRPRRTAATTSTGIWRLDLTNPRLKRTLGLGTRWGQEGAPLVPAPR